MYGQFGINSGTLNVKNFILQNSEFSLLRDGKFLGIFFSFGMIVGSSKFIWAKSTTERQRE